MRTQRVFIAVKIEKHGVWWPCNVYACLDGAHLEFHLRNPSHDTDWKTTHERFKRQK